MLATTIYLCNRTIQAAVGQPGKGRVKVKEIFSTVLGEECLIGGVITNEKALAAQLEQFWKENDLPRKNVWLVIDSTQFLVKSIQLPAVPPKKMMELVKKELAATEGRQDPLCDYMTLSHHRVSKTDTVLCSTVERGFIGSFVELFTGLGIVLEGVDIALGAQLKLLGLMPAFREKTAIVLTFDGENLMATLMENGQYKYSSRTRLFGDHGTPELGVEVARTVSGTLQFQASDKSGFAITHLYFAGCTQEDYQVCAESLGAFHLSQGWLPEDKNIRLPRGARLCDCVYNAGNLIWR